MFQFVDSEVAILDPLSSATSYFLIARFKNDHYLIQRMQKKIVKKYSELMNQMQQATGRKKAVELIHKAAKSKTKFEEYEMM
tara:strand:- start:55 stop:300 length:246 start_codon:yes stop_codon:yes gene_type:complete